MGITASKDKEVNPSLDYFTEGLEALREGRFTYSEIYFHQLLKNHPGRVFWSDLLTAAFHNPPQPEAGKKVSEKWEGEEMDEDGFAKSTKKARPKIRKTTVELPVDERLADVMEYAWLLADITFAYLKDKRRMSQSLALVYSHFVCVHMQLMLHFLTMYIEEQSIQGGLDGYWKSNREGGNPLDTVNQVPLSEVGPILELLECQCKYLWYSFTANYTILALMMVKDSDPKTRQAILYSAIDSCKVLEDTLWRKASENPRDSLSALILRHMPTASRNRGGKNDAYQPETESKNLYYCPVTGPTPIGQETFLFVARNFNPAISVLLPLTSVLPAKLVITGHGEMAPLTVVQPPHQRSSFHYLSWIANSEANVTPGQSPNLNAQIKFSSDSIAPLAIEENCLTCIIIFLTEAELVAASEDDTRAEEIRHDTMEMVSALYGEESPEFDIIQSLGEDIRNAELSIPSDRDVAFMY